MRAAALAVSMILTLAPQLASAGAWPAGDGGYYAKLSASWLSTDELATPDGRSVTIPEFERSDVTVYVEYGLGPRWTTILSAPLVIESSIDGFGSAYGPGDVSLGLQRQLLDSPTAALAVRGTLQLPTGDESLGRSLLPTGSGVREGQLVLSFGRTFSSGRGWAFVEAGHQARGGGLEDAWVHRFQVGGRVSRRSKLAWNVSGIEPYSESSSGGSGTAAGLGDGVGYLAFGPQLFVDIARGWSLEAQLEDTTRARNLATGVTVRIGLSVKR